MEKENQPTTPTTFFILCIFEGLIFIGLYWLLK